jgi:hypothetical protein
MIHMCVRKQDKIRDRQFQRVDGGMNQSLHAEGEWPDLDPNTRTEHRIGENREAIHAN